MKRFIAALALLVAGMALGHEAKTWEWTLQPLVGKYAIYGGDLGDTPPPAKDDARIAFYVRGSAAREMFAAIGPDRKNRCGIEKGGRVREKERIACYYRPSDGYQCSFGFDLTSGRSIGGSIC
ncbi:hypothetical protein HSX11_25795 [Oxalobacteraceae bacterium]|nr:hypothetical protein [Oxalobacteraceae bacterium]